jgi:hypothetical protein
MQIYKPLNKQKKPILDRDRLAEDNTMLVFPSVEGFGARQMNSSSGYRVAIPTNV